MKQVKYIQLIRNKIIVGKCKLEIDNNMDVEIKDENKYSKEFISKIKENIYGSEDDNSCCESINELEENGWLPGDVTYALTCKCILSDI